ncbi:MAG: hypothetical protein OIF40_02015 [Mangrovicoccus sp.]|nr:hypothetical protein [Mangrovicoccus sp.]
MPFPSFAWHNRHPRAARWILAGPVALILSVLFMASMPLILPAGAGGVDHLVMPVVLFPVIWCSALLYPVMADDLGRAAGVMYGLLLAEFFIVTAALFI